MTAIARRVLVMYAGRIVEVGSARALIRGGQMVLDALEALPCPTVAVIEGFALGGGLELALACRYRVGLDDGRLSLGLPEVMLGIHPGFGGTVRAVRLIGAPAALDMMLTGRNIRAAQALRLGLVVVLCTTREQLAAEAQRLLLAAAAPASSASPAPAAVVEAAAAAHAPQVEALARVREEHHVLHDAQPRVEVLGDAEREVLRRIQMTNVLILHD